MASLYPPTIEVGQNVTNKSRPTYLLHLTIASISLSIIASIFSVLDFGKSSLFLIPVAALLSVVYHAAVLVLSRRCIPSEILSYTIASKKSAIAFAYILALLWIAAFGTSLGLLVSIMVERRKGHGSDISVAIPQIVFSMAEAGVMSAMAIVTTRARRSQRYGGSWNEIRGV
jgi:hypothetical protein